MTTTPSASAHEDTFARDHLPPREQWPTLEFSLPELQYPDRLNAAVALIDEGAQRYGDRPAIRTPDGLLWTYADLRLQSDRIAQVLVDDLGVRPGNRVLLREGNTPWLVAAWLGALKAGAVLVTTMPMLRPAELEDLIERTGPTVCLSGAAVAADLAEALERNGSGAGLVLIGGDGVDRLEARAARHDGVFTPVETAADDVALLCPTSGSTGRPKITMHFHRDVLANADTFARHVLAPSPDDVFAGSPPLAFTFGLGGLVVFPLRFGASTVLTERATPLQLAEVVATHGVTVLFTAPTAYRAIIRGGGAEPLRGVRVGVSAGEDLPEETFDLVREECGIELVNGIGCTELLHVFLSTAPGRTVAGVLGTPVPGYRATVLGPDGAEVGAGTAGRLAVIGPTGCRYLDDDRQLGYVVNGWNVTGDTVVRDPDGAFRFQARSDSMIVSSGYNIGGPEVEAAICADGAVVEAAVVGRPDPERGAVVCAFVVLRVGTDAGPEMVRRIQDGVKARLAPYKYPRDVRFVVALPRNPSGKLQHFRLREQLAREAAAAVRG
ncbi:AMP-binding protein [Tsukamurella pseudospumae]|uniref:2-aminobenzoate-CoA ligase n=1 Tax=Tsukamurella pseudospumae TaxID=239498 RepID=A0A137ZSY1_9ACTN|nr:AMP-binding protein [Tsukamurella pseudospumae]KXP01277.1 2-aminobenzoate-CoA ligase [Tsukamurella pseudospumae]